MYVHSLTKSEDRVSCHSGGFILWCHFNRNFTHCTQFSTSSNIEYTWQWSGTELKQGDLGSLGELGRVQAKRTGGKFWAKASCRQMACRKWASSYQRKERHPKHVSETIVPQLHWKGEVLQTIAHQEHGKDQQIQLARTINRLRLRNINEKQALLLTYQFYTGDNVCMYSQNEKVWITILCVSFYQLAMLTMKQGK